MTRELLGAISIVFAFFLVLLALALAAVSLSKAYIFVCEKAKPKAGVPQNVRLSEWLASTAPDLKVLIF